MSNFVHCAQCGHPHFGLYGAAGLLVLADGHVLMQEWSRHVDQGGTWSVPGGALMSWEKAKDAAMREATEEPDGLEVDHLELIGAHVSDHGAWSYTTIVARVAGRPAITVRSGEAVSVAWVRLEDVSRLHLTLVWLSPGLSAAGTHWRR